MPAEQQDPGRRHIHPNKHPHIHHRLTTDMGPAMGVWPHTPSPELFQQAVQAHHAVYHRNQPEHPIPVRDFQLAEIMDDVKHAGSFRIRALREFKDLRLINPRTPGRAHIIAVALTGSSPLTIGAGTASRHSEHPCHTDQSNQAQQPDSLFTNQDVAISFSQLVRDPGWTGLDPILPLFRNKHALIIGDPTSGRPRAAVGLLPETINAEDLADDLQSTSPQIPDHPETQTLRTILEWHGATVRWLPWTQ